MREVQSYNEDDVRNEPIDENSANVKDYQFYSNDDEDFTPNRKAKERSIRDKRREKQKRRWAS